MGVRPNSSLTPTIPLNGVRISCVTVVMKVDLISFICSTVSSACLYEVTSCTNAIQYGGLAGPAGAQIVVETLDGVPSGRAMSASNARGASPAAGSGLG